MHSLDPDYLSRLAFGAGDLAALRNLGEMAGRQQLFAAQRPQELEALRNRAMIESTESSSRIEGVVAKAGRVEAIVTRHDPPRDRSEQEIAGYRDVLQTIHESHADMSFSASLLLQLHQRLFAYHPGESGRWKTVDNEIVERDATGHVYRVRFSPTPASRTAEAMRALEEAHRRARADGVEPLVLTPLTILDFLCVHPFLDGNGRLARLLTLLLLYRDGYRVGRFISLERIIEESKETYYEALEKSSAGWHESRHDPMPWLRYFWGVLTRASRRFEERVGEFGGRGSKRARVRSAVMRRMTPFGIAQIEEECPDISRDMVRKVLREMRREGILSSEGTGRGARWVKIEGSGA
jgi:Fic family protein